MKTLLSLLLITNSLGIMAKHIETRIIIHATPEQVWHAFTQFNTYPEWNPFVSKLTGTPVVGQKITVKLPGMTFNPKVLVYNANREFRWAGKLWLKGLFDGEHYFILQDNGNGTTTFIQGEHFKGFLLPLFKHMLDTKTVAGFNAMNEALKKRVESQTAALIK